MKKGTVESRATSLNIARSALAIFALLWSSSSVLASDMTLEDFRQLLLKSAEVSAVVSSRDNTAAGTIANLDYEQLQQMMDQIPNLNEYEAAVNRLLARIHSDSAGVSDSSVYATQLPGSTNLAGTQAFPPSVTGLISRGDLNAQIPPKPDYANGPQINLLTLNLGDLGAKSDTDGDGSLLDERCSADYVADLWVGKQPSVIIAAASDLCGGIPIPASLICTAPIAAAKEVIVGYEIALGQCEINDALVDSAEIEAAFENTVVIFDALNSLDSNVNNKANNLTTLIDQTKVQIITAQNNARDQIIQRISTAETNISTLIANHDTDIKNNIADHDTKINNAMSTHDTDVKNLLSNVENGVDANGAMLLEVIRLLNTPEGRRSSTYPACSGQTCTWPNN